MSENKHVYELIGDDPFNIKILNETLWDIKESMFGNLYDAQKSLNDMHRFDIDMGNPTSISKSECIYNASISFITTPRRTAYKVSNFYKKDLTPDEINENPNIFSNNIYVFINGEMYTNFYVRPLENITSIVFKLYSKFPNTAEYIRPGFTQSEINELMKSHAKMTIIVVKAHNVGILHKNRLSVVNYTMVKKYAGIPMFDFVTTNDIVETEGFTTWLTYDDARLYKYKMISTTVDNNKLYLNQNQVSSLTNTYTYIRNIFLLNHFQTVTVPAGTEYFELPIKDMPIPLENFIIFKKNGDDIFFDHDTTLTLYYPNIYKINQVQTDDLILYVYYADDTEAIGSKYQNELQLYYKFNTKIVEKYKDNTIHDIIKNYNPISISYDHNDYIKSSVDHLKYKMNKLNSMINQNGDYYSIYLHKLIGYVPTFDINVSEIDNLVSKIRINNRNEITDINQQVDFSEQCYLFIFRHNNNDSMNISIDNYQTNDLYIFYDEKYCYVYIPSRLVNPNSIITVEKFVDYRYRQQIVIENNDTYYEINIPDNQKIQMSDIYVTTKSLEGNDIYLTKNDYYLYIKRNGIYEKIINNDFYNYRKIYVKFNNALDIGKTVGVNVTRVTFKQVSTGSNTIFINRDINNDAKNILLYRNGRLVPYKLRKILFSDNVSGPHKIKGLMVENFDDVFTLVYNTNKYFMVYYQKSINKKGIINLTGKINKPLDLKWYDIYVNGLKLHESNMEILGPYIFILKNIPTLKNLEIYQKNLDSLTWDNNYPTEDISSKIFDEIVGDIESRLPEIQDIIPDLMDDIIIDIIDYFNDYLWSQIILINPDISQITNQMLTDYPAVFNDNNDLFMNPDELKNLEANVFLNPDTNTILSV